MVFKVRGASAVVTARISFKKIWRKGILTFSACTFKVKVSVKLSNVVDLCSICPNINILVNYNIELEITAKHTIGVGSCLCS